MSDELQNRHVTIEASEAQFGLPALLAATGRFLDNLVSWLD